MTKRSPIRKVWAVSIAAAIVCLCAGTAMTAETGEILIGGLFSITGNLKTLGESSKTAMEMAVADANEAARVKGSPLRFKAFIYDTRLEPARALEGIKDMASMGVRFVVGPQSSAELEAVKDLAGLSGIIVISQSSTARSLAVPGDNVFRFCPSDDHEAAAMATFMRRDRVKVVVPIWRDDPGNEELQQSVRRAVAATGVKVFDGVRYSASAEDLSGQVMDLAGQVSGAVKEYGASSVAVYVAGFDEVTSLLSLASRVPVLGTVKWYGNDGAALSETITGNETAAAFAVKTNFLCLIFSIEENSRNKWRLVVSKIEERAGRLTEGYALAAYDATQVVAQTYMAMSGRVDRTRDLRKEFIEAAASYKGITGRTALNSAGDRKYGTYDLWAVRKKGEKGYQWKLTGSYESE